MAGDCAYGKDVCVVSANFSTLAFRNTSSKSVLFGNFAKTSVSNHSTGTFSILSCAIFSSEAATPEPAKLKRKLSVAAKAKLVANLKKARAAKLAKGENSGQEIDSGPQESRRKEGSGHGCTGKRYETSAGQEDGGVEEDGPVTSAGSKAMTE